MTKRFPPRNRLPALLQKRSLWPWLGAGVVFAIGLALGSDHLSSQSSVAYLFGRTLMALTLTLGLLYASLQALKRWKGFIPHPSPHQIVLQETLSLGPRRALHLIRIRDQQFLIAATEHQITLISAIPSINSTPYSSSSLPAEALPVSFADLLNQRVTASASTPTHGTNSDAAEA